MKKLFLLAVALLFASNASAGLVWFSPAVPTDAPPATLGPYAVAGAGDDTRPNGGMVSGVGGLSFDQDVLHTEATQPGWATWSHGYTGDVYATYASLDPDSLTMTLPSDVHAFYFYAEPNVFAQFTMTAIADGGAVAFAQTVEGFAGAKYFGVFDDSGGTIETVQVSMVSGTGGFAVGEFGGDRDPTTREVPPVPEPGTMLLMGAGLVGLARKRFTKAA